MISNLIYAARYTGAGTKVGAEVDAEDNITITSIRFKLAVKSNIYLELTEKVYILLRI